MEKTITAEMKNTLASYKEFGKELIAEYFGVNTQRAAVLYA